MWLLILTLIIIWFVLRLKRDNFDTYDKRNVAIKIVNWFNNNAIISYDKYSRDVGPESNIVEYEDARLLHLAGKLTVDAMVAKL